MIGTDLAEILRQRPVREQFLACIVRQAERNGLLAGAAPPGCIWCVCATLPARLGGDVEITARIHLIDELPERSVTHAQLRADLERSAPHGCALVILYTATQAVWAATIRLAPKPKGAAA